MCDPITLSAVVAGSSVLFKGISALASNDNPSPAPIKLNADQTGVAQDLASKFNSPQPGQPGYQPVGQGLGGLGQSGLGAPGGGGYRERLNSLATRLNQSSASPVLPAQTSQLPTTTGVR